MTRTVTRATLLGVLVAQWACIPIPIGKRAPTRPATPEPAGPVARKTTDHNPTAFGPKPVVGKQPPSLLIARDGTQCTVSEDKFERTIIGTSVWCVWTEAEE